MSDDITAILHGWQFKPGEFNARIVQGGDGRERIQVRIDMGVIQMHPDGRPDGRRPHGFESMLDYLEEAARRYEQRYGSLEGFSLDDDDCAELMREGIQYYHRYLSFFHLGRYESVARDTQRNLRLFDFVTMHAAREQDRWRFDQYRPYVVMMNTRAQAMMRLEREDFRGALVVVDTGIAAIRSFLAEHAQEEGEESCLELGFLTEWRQELEKKRPLDPLEKLQRDLEAAVEGEQFERAARLRDAIRRLEGHGNSP